MLHKEILHFLITSILLLIAMDVTMILQHVAENVDMLFVELVKNCSQNE